MSASGRQAIEQDLADERVRDAAPDLLRELVQARNYVAVLAKKTSDERVHHDLAQIDAAINKATAS